MMFKKVIGCKVNAILIKVAVKHLKASRSTHVGEDQDKKKDQQKVEKIYADWLNGESSV